MKRRTLIQLGVVGSGVFALLGLGFGLSRPGLQGRRLSPAGREVFSAVASAVLAGCLPENPAQREAALSAHLERMDKTLAGLPPATLAEIAQMSSVLAHPTGRRMLAGLDADWPDASVQAVSAALQDLRTSRLAVRQQVYHALRDLTNAAYFSDPETWAVVGYAGPRVV